MGMELSKFVSILLLFDLMEGSRGVRKGAWSKLEDERLRACVQQYGEGKWNQVPKRAGLNRCRKSCRLRWLNYLNPTIKLGEFNEDEVDLIIRLHKLLGNRWSLIAGRLPGRTPNGIKNYWNTNIRKKVSSHKEDMNAKPKETNQTTMEPHVVIKPKPRTITRTWPWSRVNNKILREDQSGDKESTIDQACEAASSECNNNNNWFDTWWGTLLEDKGSNKENDTRCLGDQDGMLMEDLNWDGGLTTEVEDFLIEDQSWSDVLGDTNWWDS